MEGELIVIIQIIGFATTGGLIGEAGRTINSGYNLDKYFLANSIAGGFLAFLIGWLLYRYTQDRTLASIIAGAISYQDEKRINKLVRKFLLEFLKGGGKDD